MEAKRACRTILVVDDEAAILDIIRQVLEQTLYSWLSGKSRPLRPDRITAFLDSLPGESGSGAAPNGYEYREYKNWRGIPKPRRCPFCKEAKGEIRKVRAGFQGVCPGCGAAGPKQIDREAAPRAWNGEGRP